ncbi:MAG: VTT domain-containing protein [Acidobacteria bacterium]|jgi:membrane protein DedA with SNARE-associated domain/rhodanese-related sulfurtransferase|nr:VTT domain-containing protein [Acidobacteriota bacterium]
MHDIIPLIEQHGYFLICALVFAEAIGLPVPAAIALVVGGAAAGRHALHLPTLLVLCVSSMLLADMLLFVAGRQMGWRLLGFLCRLSSNPETCILRSAESFYKRGKITLVFAKFIPGVNAMAPPLAGSMKMRLRQFLAFDIMGVLLYVLAYGTLGYAFRGLLGRILRGMRTASLALEIVILAALLGYLVYRILLYRKYSVYRVVPRIQVEELAQKLSQEQDGNILLMDVRSHGYYDSGATRIKGSIRFEPNNLEEEVKLLPRDKDIYVYCTCPRDATSSKVAHLLREQGFNAFVIVGGLAAWRKAGQPLETAPLDDVVKLPTFS